MPLSINTLGDLKRSGQDMIAVCRNIYCRHRQMVDLQMVIDHVGAMHPLLPAKGQIHFSERMRCPRCKQVGFYVWMGEPKEPEPVFSGMSYAVNEWSRNDEILLTTIARIKHVEVAHATYQAALSAYPGKHLTLQQGTFLMQDSRLRLIEGGKRS